MSSIYDTGVSGGTGLPNITALRVVQLDPVTGAPATENQQASAFVAVENDVDIAVKTSAGRLQSVIATNYNAAKRYLQIHNKASAPTSGNTATISVPIPAGTADTPGYVELGTEFLGANGFYLGTGIAIGVSTVGATFTAATTTDHVVTGTYV